MTINDEPSDFRLTNELFEDETVLWAGQPTGTRMALQRLPLALVGLVFFFAVSTLFARIPLGPMMSMQGPMMSMPFSLFGLVQPVLAVAGLALAATPLWAFFAANRTWYAVTDQRVLIINGGITSSTVSYGPEDIECVERRNNFSGSGDVIFRHETRARTSPDTHGHSHSTLHRVPVGFFGIQNAREVEALLMEFAFNDAVTADEAPLTTESLMLGALAGQDRRKQKRSGK